LQIALFHLLICELAEAKGSLVVAELRSGDRGERGAGEPSAVAVAVLEAEIDRLARDERKQVLVREICRHCDLQNNVECCKGLKVSHRREIDHLLDRSRAE